MMQDSRDMFSSERPNHTGLEVGVVESISGADLHIRLLEDSNKNDVLEIRTNAGTIELTCNKEGKAGDVISIKGREIKNIENGDKVFRTRNNKLIEQIGKETIDAERKLKVRAIVEAKKEKELKIHLFDSEKTEGVSVLGGVVRQAKNNPVSREKLLEKLAKTGGSNIALDVEFDMDDDIFISMSEFNNLRREAIKLFKEYKSKKYRRSEQVR